MESDDERIESGEHGDPADEGLRDHADQHQPREGGEVAACRDDPQRVHGADHGGEDESHGEEGERLVDEQCGDPEADRAGNDAACGEPQRRDQRAPSADGMEGEQEHSDCEEPDDAGHRAVAELDDAVNALDLVDRHERFGGAQRPVRASETGAGEAHCAAGGDDDDLGEEGQPGEHPERAAEHR